MNSLWLFVLASSIMLCSGYYRGQIPKDKYSVLNPSIENKEVFDPAKHITEFSPEAAMYYSWFTSYAYCTVDRIIKDKKCCNHMYGKDKYWDLVDISEPEGQKNNTYLFFKSERYKKVVLAFPATRGMKMLMEEIITTNLVSLYDEFDGIGVHPYFRNTTINIISHLKKRQGETLKKLSDEGYQFIFVGHSLGAAVATIGALISVDDKKYHLIDPKKTDPVLITYGQPRTGNPFFANQVMKKIPHVFRMVKRGDIVTTVPFCNYRVFKSRCIGSPFDDFTDLSRYKKSYLERSKPIPAGGFWHIGGKYIINSDFKTLDVCDENRGENYPNSKCFNLLSVDLKNHEYYFNDKEGLSSRCLEGVDIGNIFK